jgi:hypothetical protein
LPRAEAQSRGVFEVQVHSSFGTTFTDCFRFSAPRTGILNIDGFGSPLTYRFGGLDSDRLAWKSVTISPPPFAIMFFGQFSPFGRIKGEALNEFGDTFILNGVLNESCSLAPTGLGRNWRAP